MSQEQYNKMWKEINATGTTIYGETIALFPDELLNAKDRELKANVLRCQKLQKKAQEEQYRNTMNAFYKRLGWA